MTLTDFLNARIDEDETTAFGLGADGYTLTALGDKIVTTVGGRRLRAECDAKRALLKLHPTSIHHPDNSRRPVNPLPDTHHCACQVDDGVLVGKEPCETKRILAGPYASHPDFDPAWLL